MDALLPKNTWFVGYARSKLTVEDIKKKCKPFMKVENMQELFLYQIHTHFLWFTNF